MKSVLLSLLLLHSWVAFADPYKYGELFFIEKAKHKHSKLYILGSTITDSSLIDSYGLGLNCSFYSSPLFRFSTEATFRKTKESESSKIINQNTNVLQKTNQPGSSVHLVSSLLFLKAKSSLLNKFYQDLQLYLDLGLGATQYSKHTFKPSTPWSLYGGTTLEIPFKKVSFVAKYRRVSDNFNGRDKFNYNELMLGAGFKW